MYCLISRIITAYISIYRTIYACIVENALPSNKYSILEESAIKNLRDRCSSKYRAGYVLLLSM